MCVNYVYTVVRCMRDVECSGFEMDGGVVEAAFLLVRGQFYVADVPERDIGRLSLSSDVVL